MVQEVLKESLLDLMMKRIELVKKRIVVQEILKESSFRSDDEDNKTRKLKLNNS